MLQTAIAKSEEFSIQDFIDSYNVGARSKYLKIYSACDKGRKFNKRRPLKDALRYPYIQPNSPYNISWLVFDIDRNFDFNEIADKNLCQPNFVIWNNENNHAQVWYKLRDPIWIQEKFKNCRAYNYQKAVYEGIRAALDADKHFNRALCKNPFYSGADVNWSRVDFTRQEYSLIELCNHIDINFENEKKEVEKSNFVFSMDTPENYAGAEKGSRNSSLFDHCRFSIYKYFSNSNCSENELLEWSRQFIALQNTYNNPPLADRECEAMAKSIASWTFSNIQPRAQKKEKYDDRARERSLITRRKAQQKKISKIRKFLKHNPEMSNRAIAEKFGYSLGCVNSYIAKIRHQQAQAENARKNKEAQKAHAAESRFFSAQQNSLNEQFVNQFVCAAIDNQDVKNKRRLKWEKRESRDGFI